MGDAERSAVSAQSHDESVAELRVSRRESSTWKIPIGTIVIIYNRIVEWFGLERDLKDKQGYLPLD